MFQLKVILSFTSWVFVMVLIPIFAICIFFRVDRKERNEVAWLFTEYDVALGIQCAEISM